MDGVGLSTGSLYLRLLFASLLNMHPKKNRLDILPGADLHAWYALLMPTLSVLRPVKPARLLHGCGGTARRFPVPRTPSPP